MNGIGTAHGYVCLWNEPSWNLVADGESRFDIVAPRAITFAPDVRANLWHIRDTFFASIGRGTLEMFSDARGVGFAAEIPETPDGYNLFNGLRDGRSLGVSAELCDVTAKWHGDERIITRAELSGFAISDISATAFPQLRCWLCGDEWLIDPQARALAERFWVRRRPVANQKRKPEPPTSDRALIASYLAKIDADRQRPAKKRKPLIEIPPIPEAWRAAMEAGLYL